MGKEQPVSFGASVLSHTLGIHSQDEYKRQKEEVARLQKEMAETERARARVLEEALEAKEALVGLSVCQSDDDETDYDNASARVRESRGGAAGEQGNLIDERTGARDKTREGTRTGGGSGGDGRERKGGCKGERARGEEAVFAGAASSRAGKHDGGDGRKRREGEGWVGRGG